MPALNSGYLFQDFENPAWPPAGWTLANTSGYNWVRTVVCSGYGTGSACIKADFFDYPSGTFDIITSTFPATIANDSVRFDHAYATFSGENDNLSIYTSINNGSSWVLLINLPGGSSGPLVTAPATQSCFVPTSSQWATKRYVLPVGTNKIKFTGNTAYGNNLYLDNIRIGTPYANDVGANGIAVPKGALTPGTVTPKATVKNYGSTTQSFSVTMTINPGGFSNTQSVSNLTAGSSALVTFSNFNFATTGTYTVKAYATLGNDDNRANDTATYNVLVTNTLRNAILEYCTGTWCQWCPCGKEQALLLQNNYPNSIILAYHGGSDPWVTFNGSNIISLLGFTGYPSGVLDRKGILGWGSFFTDGENRYATSPAASVDLVITNKTYNTTTRQLDVTLTAKALETLSGQYKINYVITEDNMVYTQSGNSWCVGGSNYVHYWVVRNMVNNAQGENVNSGTWNQNQIYTKTFSTTLNAAWNAANCKLQVFVYKDLGALNTSEIQQGIKTPIIPVGIGTGNNGIPVKYELGQNFPNPFNPTTNVKFSIPKSGMVTLKIYDIQGKVVDTYMDGYLQAGEYNAEFDGAKLASGVYFYNLTADGFSETKKMMLIK
ncbi:MAG: T9SS C-terminal target domain-containing protein [Ignavibacteriae bacterium]|nr:MAG: T9SS C-terminal target domain-containing protein [Ignavibacteriota bacterium]